MCYSEALQQFYCSTLCISYPSIVFANPTSLLRLDVPPIILRVKLLHYTASFYFVLSSAHVGKELVIFWFKKLTFNSVMPFGLFLCFVCFLNLHFEHFRSIILLRITKLYM